MSAALTSPTLTSPAVLSTAMSPAVLGVLVALAAYAGLSPWRWAARASSRRVSTLAADPSPRDDPAGQGPVAPSMDVPCLLELVAAAVRSGAGVPRALEAVAAAVDGPDGRALARVAAALRLGAGWDAAWAGACGETGRPAAPHRLDVLRRALRGAWVDGAAPGESLRAAGAEHRHERQAAARTAAARLAVRLVLPLGLCYLPAFVLVGLVPVLLALGVDLLSG
ncbi:type II secretion system (T2SS) protein F [Isoptericola sp. CG 20/1183]|uniref:Type II secretion system (T2SS) protein F n=1 Tax=Isoptericola halotolerans TaxID=300560 RepID=A0ABX5EIF5_9MICO|nr:MULTISPECIES: type II secretion system F family protein [Isoptericola]PRZ09470.1 type II secretion system (T2SS) protein F [Isoptericola sp. CG 20/1183]PRZ10271.1 type II secretion system (T2SS) protein F [Isoptericola halotolerans]